MLTASKWFGTQKFNVKPIASKMKKFLCCMVLMMLAMSVSAMAQTKAASPPEQDIGLSVARLFKVETKLN